MDQELWTELLGSSQEMLLYTVCSSGRMQWVAGRHCGSTHQMAALFCSNDVMAAIFNVWRRIRNPTLTIDVYLFEGQSCQISSRSNLIRQSLRLLFFEEARSNKKNKMSSNMGSVLGCLGGAAVRRRTPDQKVASSLSSRSTQPSIPPG